MKEKLNLFNFNNISIAYGIASLWLVSDTEILISLDISKYCTVFILTCQVRKKKKVFVTLLEIVVSFESFCFV